MSTQKFQDACKKDFFGRCILLVLNDNEKPLNRSEITGLLIERSQFTFGDGELFNRIISTFRKAGLIEPDRTSDRLRLTKAGAALVRKDYPNRYTGIEYEIDLKKVRTFYDEFIKNIENHPSKKMLKDRFIKLLGHPRREDWRYFRLQLQTWQDAGTLERKIQFLEEFHQEYQQ